MNSLRSCLPFVLLSLVGASAPITAPAVAPHGDYVEARTASVFCGACHYNGERVTDGRSAVMAWSIKAGTFQNVDLSGVKVMAVVTADDNLAEATAGRRTEIVVQADGNAAADAAVAWVKDRTGGQLGDVVGVRRSCVNFAHTSDAFAVSAPAFAAIAVKAMPDAACCSQPHLVWYSPLMAVEGRKVGYTESAVYESGRVGNAWSRGDENSAFYGTF